MHELINRLKENAGLSEKQAIQSVEVIKEYVKEKFPMLSGAVDSLFSPPSEKE